MLLKSLIVLLALSALPAKGYVLQPELNNLLTELIETLQIVSNARILDASLQELTGTEEQVRIPQNILVSRSDTLPAEALCLLEVVENSDAETQALAEEFIKESINWLNLQQQRDQELQVCEALLDDNSSVWSVAQYQSCRLQVQATTGVAVTVSATRARLLFWELREIHFDAAICIVGVV